MQTYNLILIPCILSLVTIIGVSYNIITIYKKENKENLNTKVNTIIYFFLFIMLLLSEVAYSVIIYKNLTDSGIMKIELNIFSNYILLSLVAIILKFFVGYYFFQKIPYKNEYLIQKGGFFGKIIENKSKHIKYGQKPILVSFMIVGMSLVEGVGIFGLIIALQVLQTLK